MIDYFEWFVDGFRVLTSFSEEEYNSELPLVLMVHGNSACAETFALMIREFMALHLHSKVNFIAVDLPGCGMSLRLNEYSMKIVGDAVTELINTRFKTSRFYYVGHSLGGHLEPWININKAGVAIIGTPPLNGPGDFSNAFNPDEEAKELIPLLSKRERFTVQETLKFVLHTGMKGEFLEQMFVMTDSADGRFREGCLRTLADVDQKSHLETMKNVIVIHALQDGVISREYLETIDKSCLYQNKIHCVDAKHMSPILKADEIVQILIAGFCL